MEALVDVTYRGLELGRRLKLREVGPTTAYVEHATPMPVGAQLVLATEDGLQIPALVLRVHEQVAGAEMPPGMRVQALGLEGDAASWWGRLRTQEADPRIPEPATPVGVVEQAASAPAAEVGTEANAEADAEASEASAPAEQEDRPDERPTEIMAAVDPEAIEAAEREGAAASKAGANGGSRKTTVMSAQQIREAIGGDPEPAETSAAAGPEDDAPSRPGGNGTADPTARGKSTRRRRSRKR